MTDLTTWLLERIGEDEAAARAATPGPWNSGAQYADANIWQGDDHSMGIAHASWEYDESSAATFAHIARHDPARVLAQCAAHKAIVQAHRRDISLDYCATCFSGDFNRLDEPQHEEWPCPTLRALASIYAGAEGWREEWAL